jgi:hypothetical protein
MNLSPTEGTVAKPLEPATYYLPEKGPGAVLKIKVDPADHWRIDSDEYAKTNARIPLDRVVGISHFLDGMPATEAQATAAYSAAFAWVTVDPQKATAFSRFKQALRALGARFGRVTFDDGRWVTIDGQHVLIGKGGEILQGGGHLDGSKAGTKHNEGFRDVSAARFKRAIHEASDTTKAGAKVADTLSEYSLSDYQHMHPVLSMDGKTGYALKPRDDGGMELVSVFNVGGKGKGSQAVADAVQAGATHLDAFDQGGFLPNLYAKYGFHETGRAKWDPAMAGADSLPDGSKPDVVFMERDAAKHSAFADMLFPQAGPDMHEVNPEHAPTRAFPAHYGYRRKRSPAELAAERATVEEQLTREGHDAARGVAPFADSGHWVTIDGNPVLVGGSGASGSGERTVRDRGAPAHGEPPVGVQQPRAQALAYLRQAPGVLTRNQMENMVSQALPSSPAVSLIDLNTPSIQPQVVALAEVAQDYPVAGKDLSYVGVYSGVDEPLSAGGGPVPWDDGAYAQVSQVQPAGERAIGFNPVYFATQSVGAKLPAAVDMQDQVDFNRDSGWFPSVAKHPGFIAVHEYGHVVQDNMIKTDARTVLDWSESHPPDPTLSFYSAKTDTAGQKAGNELFAEAFAAYYYGSAHPYAKDMGTLLTHYYGNAPTYAGAPAQHSAAFGWVTLDDGRHVFIGDSGASGPAYPRAVRTATEHAARQAASLERTTTPLLQKIADAEGARLEGLQFRLKGQDSLAGKINTRFQATDHGTTPEEAAAKVTDALRYTMMAEPATLASTTRTTINTLEAAGYQVKADNFWVPGDAYNGLNADVKDLATGQTFELQFHTPESWHVKQDVNHHDYEVMQNRSGKESVATRQEAFDRMQKIADGMVRPDSIMSVGNPRLKPFQP